MKLKPLNIIIISLFFNFFVKGQSDSISKWNVNESSKKEFEYLKSSQPHLFEKDTSINKKNEYLSKLPSKSIVDSIKVHKPNKDSVKSNLVHQFKKDSLPNKRSVIKNFKKVIPLGTISVGYDYGFLPYTVNMPSPAQAFKTEGQIGLNLLNIPIDITYFYSSQKNLIGLNNYFRISYNADRYKDNLNNKLTENTDRYKNQLGDLNAQKQQLMQKMAYTDYLSSISPNVWPVDTTLFKNKTKPIGSTTFSNQITKPDSINYNYQKPDSSLYANQYAIQDSSKSNPHSNKADSVQQITKIYKHRSDSVRELYDGFKNQYDLLNDSIKKTQNKINQLESLSNSSNSAYLNRIPYFNKIQNFLSGVKRFEIGLCYPNNSTFLANNVPVRGLNFEYGKNNKYFALVYGTTVSTVLYNNRNIDGFLQNVRNSYNYFDFNNVNTGRKILSAKFGVGSKEGNHFFVGFLVGKGQSNYMPLITEGISFNSKESNVVLEADIRYKISKGTAFDLIIGKSSLRSDDLNYETIKSSMNEIFSNYRSNAVLIKLSTKIIPTNSSLTLSFRYVDPFFKSFGTGFIRSDNMRYEVKLDQPISKKLKYTGMFRYEEDNLLQIMNYKNQFYSFNNTLSLKVKRGLMLRASYTPLFRNLNSDSYVIKNKNSITTGVITFIPRTRKTSLQFSLLYNYYIVNTDSQRINFQNVAYSHVISFKKGFKTGLSISGFRNNLRDTLNNNVFLGVLDIGYQFKNGSSLTLAGKSAYKLNGQIYPGFVFKSNLKLLKCLFWENQVEKFIVGDLFNGYDLENLKKFPYYCSTRLIFNF